jgi:hypothetical protein
MSPLAKYLYSVTPAPTTADNPLVASNWFGVFKQWSKGANFSTRVDHRFSDLDNIYVRYSQSISRGRSPFGTLVALNDATGWTRSDVPTKTLSANYVRTLTPTFFNELNVSGYYNEYYNEPPVIVPPSGSTWQEYLGLPNPFNSTYFPMLQSTGVGSYTFRNNAPQNYHAAHVVVEDNATKLLEKHQLEFGFHYRYNQSNQFPQQWFPEGIHNASSAATALYDPAASTPVNPAPLGRTGHELANMFIGLLNYENQMNRGWYNIRERDYALYINDTYKFFPANRQWVMDAGLVKNIRIGERLTCRFNIEFFNVFNTPGNPVMRSGQEGFLSTRTSGQDARTAQFSLRLIW